MARLALEAVPAGHSGFESDTIAWNERRHVRTDLGHCTGGFVTQDHRRFHDEVSDTSGVPVMDIGAAYSCVVDAHDDISGVLKIGDRAVFVRDFVGLMEDEGGILDI